MAREYKVFAYDFVLIIAAVPSSLSVVMVNAATEISISPLIKSPTTPFHSPVSGSLESSVYVEKILSMQRNFLFILNILVDYLYILQTYLAP